MLKPCVRTKHGSIELRRCAAEHCSATETREKATNIGSDCLLPDLSRWLQLFLALHPSCLKPPLPSQMAAAAGPITFSATPLRTNRALSLRGPPATTTLAQLYLFLRQTGPVASLHRDARDSSIFVCKYVHWKVNGASRALNRPTGTQTPLQRRHASAISTAAPSTANRFRFAAFLQLHSPSSCSLLGRRLRRTPTGSHQFHHVQQGSRIALPWPTPFNRRFPPGFPPFVRSSHPNRHGPRLPPAACQPVGRGGRR